jgi:hypothetical protein
VHCAVDTNAAAADWIFVGSAGGARIDHERMRSALRTVRRGGRMALLTQNRHGLHWLADWRPRATADDRAALSLADACELLHHAGAEDVRAYALLPHHEAPRVMIPVAPPCPAAAQRHALDQVWQRATPLGALTRALLGLCIEFGCMRQLYPSYLVVGRKP